MQFSHQTSILSISIQFKKVYVIHININKIGKLIVSFQSVNMSPGYKGYSSSSNATKCTMPQQRGKKIYKEKPVLILKGNTAYLPMVPNDALCRQYLFRLSSKEYQLVLEKILKDLNALMRFNQQDFFSQLETQDSLRVCLQSCLVCFCKNPFYDLKQTGSPDDDMQKQPKIHNQQYFLLYSKLEQTVLRIYNRIADAETQQHKQIVYNSWLMDVPKMVDLGMVYCVRVREDDDSEKEIRYTNLQIVKQIIRKAFQTNPSDYIRDFNDFINIIYEQKIPTIKSNIQIIINLSQQAMNNAKKNFSNPLRSFLITSNKLIFQIKDLYLIVTYCLLCFPQQLGRKLCGDHQLLQDLIKIYVEFRGNFRLWNIGEEFRQKFEINVKDIDRVFGEWLVMSFQTLKGVMQGGDTVQNDSFSKAVTSYSVKCLYLTSPKVTASYQKSYLDVIKTIIYQFDCQQPFFLQFPPNDLKLIKLSQQQKQAICNSYKLGKQISQQIKEARQRTFMLNRAQFHVDKFFSKLKRVQDKQRINYDVQGYQKGMNSDMSVCGFILGEGDRDIDKRLKNDLEGSFIKQSLDFDQLLDDGAGEIKQSKFQDLDLSFEQLKSSDSSQQQGQVKINQMRRASLLQPQGLFYESIPPPAQLVNKLILQQNQLSSSVYQRSSQIQYQDEHEQLDQIKQQYYHWNRPEFGLIWEIPQGGKEQQEQK